MYRILSLDLIPLPVRHFEETIAAALKHRQDHWTKGMSIIASAGIANRANNVQAAAALLWEDKEGCQNHVLKKTYEHAGFWLRCGVVLVCLQIVILLMTCMCISFATI
jgi:hypothetical protein